LNGSPVPGATVTFSPKGEYPAAFAVTNAQGEYQLTTYESGDGAAEGAYSVVVMKVISASDGPTGHEAYAKGGPGASSHSRAAAGQAGSALPPRYGSATETPLTADVKSSGDNVIDLKLES
jgi:hypothetical protein